MFEAATGARFSFVSFVAVLIGLMTSYEVGSCCFAQNDSSPPRSRNIALDRREPATVEGDREFGKSLAILIGVQNYANASLKYCHNDVSRLKKELANCGYDDFVVMLDNPELVANQEAFQPTFGMILQQVRRALERAESQGYRRILFYYSGHGYRDEDKQLFLLPMDYDPKRIPRTAVSLHQLQQMFQSTKSVPIRLLVLDCCHAGAGKSPSEGFDQDDIDEVFKNASGTLTIASSQSDEKSLEWDAKKQGVFTYWLCEGVSGRADRDRNRLIDHQELYNYLFVNVQKTAHQLLADQTVTLGMSTDWRGVAVIAKLPNADTSADSQFRNGAGLTMRKLPAGKFVQGAADGARDERPPREVTITRTFWISETEVTNSAFQTFVADKKYHTEAEMDGEGGGGVRAGKLILRDAEFHWRNVGWPATPEHPVVNVTWNDAVAFTKWLSERDGRTYRLPTEAEWEYACRAGGKSRFATGDDVESLSTAANVADAALRDLLGTVKAESWNDGYPTTAPVGSFARSAWGLADMAGNVWEWCDDGYDADAFSRTPATDPRGVDGAPTKVLRGGSWFNRGEFARPSARSHSAPGDRGPMYGFRVVCESKP